VKWRVIIVGLVLVAGACTDDDAEPIFTSTSAATETTTVSETTTTPGSTVATTTTTLASTTTLAVAEGPCVIPDSADSLVTHLDFDGLPSDLGILGRPATVVIDDALAAEEFYLTQFDHAAWAGPVGPITETVAVIADNPAAVTPDIASLGTSSLPNVLRMFDEGHFSVVAHRSLAGQMDFFGFNVGFGHFSEGMERPDTVELEVNISLLPFHELDGSITEASWDSVTVTLGPGPQPITTCVYLENTLGVGHPLFSTWLIDVYPRHADGTLIHLPIGIDDLFYGCFPTAGPDSECATPWGATGMDLIAFTNSFFQQNFYGLYVVDPDAGAAVPLLTHLVDRDVADPAWSPDGGWIAFTQRSDPGDPPPITNNLYAIRGDGSGLFQLTSGGNVWGFDWSPDGDRIAYSLGETDSDADIWIVDASGGVPVRLTDLGDAVGAVEPVWSPDGTRIAFERGTRPGGIFWESDLYLLDAGGGVPTPAITVPLAAGPVNHSHSWSPDGTRIAYSSSFEDGGGVVWVVNVAAGTESSVSGGVGETASPAWSPAADEIAFFGWSGGTGIWVVNADGSGLTALPADITWGSPVDWSADGSRLAYYGDDSVADGTAIWIINRDGTGVAQVTDLAGSEFGPAWSP